MSRGTLIKRLDELEVFLRRGSASAERRFLEGLSDEELEALYLELGGEPEADRRVVTSRDVEVAVVDEPLPPVPESEVEEDSPLTEESEEAPEPQPLALGSEEGEESPVETQREPRVRRSTDLPESRAGERARLFELETVRLAEPGDVPGSGFGRWFPPRRRRRRSRRF